MLWKEVDLPADIAAQKSLQDGIDGVKQLQDKKIRNMDTSLERPAYTTKRTTSATLSNKQASKPVNAKQVVDVDMEEEEEKQPM